MNEKLTEKQIEYFFKEEAKKITIATFIKYSETGEGFYYAIQYKLMNGFTRIRTLNIEEIIKLENLEKSKPFSIRVKIGESKEEIDEKINSMRKKVDKFVIKLNF